MNNAPLPTQTRNTQTMSPTTWIHRLSLGLLLTLSAAAQWAQAAPTLTLTSPGEGWVYNAPAASVPLRASAVAESGTTITKVEFLANGTVLYTDTIAAYAWNWSAVPSGTYTLTARATDSLGQTTESAPVTLSISSNNQPPKISLTAAANNSTYALPASVILTASAADPEKNGKIAQVDFQINGQTVATVSQSPWSATWIPAPDTTAAGSYTLTAIATDNLGAVTTSTARTLKLITVNDPPKVSLSGPADKSTYLAPVQLPLTVGASDIDSNTPVTQVDILVNGQVAKSFTQKPYTWTWEPLPGTVTLSAQATDNRGLIGSLAARTITITASNTAPTVSLTTPANNSTYALPAEIIVSASASDREKNDGLAQVEFLANGVSLGRITTAPYKITWTPTAAGTITLTAVATDKQGASTTSAARTITLADTNAAPKISLSTPANNARYLLQPNLQIPISVSASDINANTPVTQVDLLVNGELLQSLTQKPHTANWAPTAPGTYTLSATATDNRNITGTAAARTVTLSDTNTAPIISLTAPANKSLFGAPASITLTASASAPEVNDAITQVEFYQGTSLIGTATQKPYTIIWENVAQGNYTLTAKATDGQGATTTSAARTLTVGPNTLPSISITRPTAGQQFPPESQIEVSATASDKDGKVTKVEFYQGTTRIGEATKAPYTITWSKPPVGDYRLSAKGIDSSGGETFSSAVPVTIGTPTRLYFIHSDHLNTPRLITDEQKNVVWRNLPTTEPFGVSAVEEDPNNTGNRFEFNLRFPGQYQDKETNLHYNYFRDYNPNTGRYVQSDPIGLEGGINTYAYVGGNPLVRIDPEGRWFIFAFASAGGGTIAAAGGTGGIGTGYAVIGGALTAALVKGANASATQGICEANKADCDKEWEEAYAICEELLRSDSSKNNWRQVGKRPASLFSCAKGYVSEPCGGNKVE